MGKIFYVYFMTNRSNKVLYTGVTSALEKRVYQHKNKAIEGFSKKYNTTKLVYFEQYCDAENAITREKQIKNWRRDKKDFLVNEVNPEWDDLSLSFYETDISSTRAYALGRDDERAA